MAKVKIQGNASGTGVLTVTAPNTSTDRTITLPDATGTLIADNGSGKVGIGTSSPDGTAHIHTASAGSVTANADADDLVVENSGHTGINILSPDASRSAIQLGHTSDNLKMQIRHDGSTSLTQIISDDAITFNVTDGSESIRVTANGITFQGDTAAANALDDYEEGTWTPTLLGTGGGSGTLNSSYDHGSYTKIGNLVYFNAYIIASSLGNMSNAVKIGGLPFTVKSGEYNPVNFAGAEGLNITAGVSLTGFTNSNSTEFYLQQFSATTGTAAYGLYIAELSADGGFIASGCYRVA